MSSINAHHGMPKIGLIGGVSWVSSMEYYRRLNLLAQKAGGGHVSADLILISLNFSEILAFQQADNPTAERDILLKAALVIQQAGAKKLLICSNTTSNTCDLLQAALQLEVVNIIDVTCDHIVRAGYRRVGLLGTAYVMERAFYRSKLEARGVQVDIPDAAERDAIHKVIYQELCYGIFRPGSQALMLNAIGRLSRRGAEAVILGCTEIPLLLPGFASHQGTTVIDSIDVHINASLLTQQDGMQKGFVE